jgi:hypothetical protein
VELVSRLASTRDDLVMIMSAVKSKKADLKDAQGRLRDQLKLCQEQIGLGQRWGSKAAASKVEDPSAPGIGLSPHDLRGMFKRQRETGKSVEEVEQEMLAEKGAETPPLDSFPYLGLCAVCGEPQYRTPSGSLCENGHGGAPTVQDVPAVPEPPPPSEAAEPVPEPQPSQVVEGVTADADFLEDLLADVLSQESELTADEQNIATALDELYS